MMEVPSEYLKQKEIDHIVICGVYAEGCVRATALDARRAGLCATLISDGVASDRAFKFNWALSKMQKEKFEFFRLRSTCIRMPRDRPEVARYARRQALRERRRS